MSLKGSLVKYYDETKPMRKALISKFREVVDHLKPLGLDLEMEQNYNDNNYYTAIRATVCGINPVYSEHPSKEEFTKLVADLKSHRESGGEDEEFFENNETVINSSVPGDLEELASEVIAHNINIDTLYDFIDSVEYGIEEWMLPDLD